MKFALKLWKGGICQKKFSEKFWGIGVFINMSIKSGVYNELPMWSDSFNEDEVNTINQFASSFKNPVKVIDSNGGFIDLYQRVYRDERRIVIKKMGEEYYVITHYNNQYLNSYKLNSLSELSNLPDLHLRNPLFE